MNDLEESDTHQSIQLFELDGEAVRRALLGQQYFPNVKERERELPPLFSSTTFTTEIAQELTNRGDCNIEYAAWVDFRARRFDGLVRRFGLPHPVPYSRLVLHIADHWHDIAPHLSSPNSRIKPRVHSDGRIVKMDYERSADTIRDLNKLAHGKRFIVNADISNCFPSVYSHAIDWSLRGKLVAKADRKSRTWQGKLDRLIRNCHDSETKGLIIGPAVSNLLSELVLQKVDEIMRGAGYSFYRYIDDYTAFANDRNAAEQFVVDLQHALGLYRLDVNTRKTTIRDLADGMGDEWIPELLAHDVADHKPLTEVRYLRISEVLARKYPTRSILKFALKRLSSTRKLSGAKSSPLVISEIIRLCEFYPHLVPLLATQLRALDSTSVLDVGHLAVVLESQMSMAAHRRETDVVLWYLYILRVMLRHQVLKSAWSVLLDTDDDLVLLGTAALCPRAKRAVAKKVVSWDYPSESDRQEHWLARYELYRVGLLKPTDLSESEKSWMNMLSKRGVSFSIL